MPTFRVATFNLHHCAGLDGRVDVERIAAVIARTSADLVALQELDRGMARSGRMDQPEALGRVTGMAIDFHPTLERDGGEYGIAVATRGERPSFRFQALPRVGDEEPRGCLVGDWMGATVIATHLSVRPEARRRQTATLIARARDIPGPRVLLGDLNQGVWGLRRSAGEVFQVPLWPRRTMARRWSQRDHIVGGGGAVVERLKSYPSDASDHYAFAADIRLA